MKMLITDDINYAYDDYDGDAGWSSGYGANL